MSVRGGCLCGMVQFEVDLPFAKFVRCHCSRCRRATGSTFSTGQTLPTGNTSTAASASPHASTPASQFASDVLSYLTGLQDVAGTAATVALGSSPLGIAAGIGIQGVLSLAGDVAKSLKHGG